MACSPNLSPTDNVCTLRQETAKWTQKYSAAETLCEAGIRKPSTLDFSCFCYVQWLLQLRTLVSHLHFTLHDILIGNVVQLLVCGNRVKVMYNVWGFVFWRVVFFSCHSFAFRWGCVFSFATNANLVFLSQKTLSGSCSDSCCELEMFTPEVSGQET